MVKLPMPRLLLKSRSSQLPGLTSATGKEQLLRHQELVQLLQGTVIAGRMPSEEEQGALEPLVAVVVPQPLAQTLRRKSWQRRLARRPTIGPPISHQKLMLVEELSHPRPDLDQQRVLQRRVCPRRPMRILSGKRERKRKRSSETICKPMKIIE